MVKVGHERPWKLSVLVRTGAAIELALRRLLQWAAPRSDSDPDTGSDSGL